MRLAIALALTLVLAGNVLATDLGSHRLRQKDTSHIGLNPGTPDGREGGETIETAVPIPGLPYYDTGNTSDNINDYDIECPYIGSDSPDVVYSYLAVSDGIVSVDLCGSSYDTKLWVWDSEQTLIACNDDFYFDEECGQYVSFIYAAEMQAGETYYIVVDGYGGDAGDYILSVHYIASPDPCDLPCNGMVEGEPPLMDEYEDIFNGGCSVHPGPAIQELIADPNGNLEFCGKSGWYDLAGGDIRDTDWFSVIMGSTGSIEWTLSAQEETYIFLLGPTDCDNVGVLVDQIAGTCNSTTMTITGTPGDVIWLWVGPTTYEPPPYFEGFEYEYVCTFTGLAEGPVATEGINFGSIKSLYR